MKKHVMLSLGILLAILFGFRTVLALLKPGIGNKEAYLVGGLVLAGWLIKGGLSEMRYAREQSKQSG